MVNRVTAGFMESSVKPPLPHGQPSCTETRLLSASTASARQWQHGLTRTLIANMVTGVTNGFTKYLEISGVGYRAQVSGKNLVLQVGYSHPVEIGRAHV